MRILGSSKLASSIDWGGVVRFSATSGPNTSVLKIKVSRGSLSPTMGLPEACFDSVDNGLTWMKNNEDLEYLSYPSYAFPNGWVQSLANPETWIFSNWTNQIMMSPDGRRTKTSHIIRFDNRSESLEGTIVGTSRRTDDIVYVLVRDKSTGSRATIVSHDRGRTWQLLTDQVHYLVESPSNPVRMYGCAGLNEDFEIKRSNDGGKTWTRLAFSDYLRRPFWLETTTGLYRTYKADPSREAVQDQEERTNSYPIETLSVDASNPDILFVQTDQGVFRTSNGGAMFVLLRFGSDLYRGIKVFTADPRVAGMVYGLTQSGHLWRSTDYGCNWSLLNTPHDF